MFDRSIRLVQTSGSLRKAVSSASLALTAMIVIWGAAPASAGQDAFLKARMTVSAPAGAAGLCGRYPWACKTTQAAAMRVSDSQLTYAVQLNRQINGSVRSVSDQAQYGVVEHWALPTARGGDCEDFALLKKKRLIEAGLNPQMLLVATVLDRQRNAHAVLVLRTAHGDLVLDNLRDDVLHWRQTGYTFLRMQDPANPGRWTAVIDGGILRNDNAVSSPRVEAAVSRPSSVRVAKIAFSR